MSLNNDYLDYPLRRYGMDHERYPWSMLSERPKIQWPNGKKLAVWINVSVQYFPLNQRNIPFKVPHGMTMPYPDLRHYSLREYGNRVGIYRIFDAFKRYGIRPSYAVNAQMVNKHPYLFQQITQQDCEILAHGWNMGHQHYGGMAIGEETQLVQESLNTIRNATDRPIKGWLSPAKNQSENTPSLLVENGIDFCCDWVNDDMPYDFNTPSGSLVNIPLSTEIEDAFVINNNLHSEISWQEQVTDAFDFLLSEANSQGGRLLAINIHPWLIGQPHRIQCLEEVLKHISESEDVWQATPSEIVTVFQEQK